MNTKTAKDIVFDREKALDDYERKLGLPSTNLFQNDEELQNYFIMDKKQIESLSASACSVIGYRLAQYSFQIQRLVNKEKSMALYAEMKLNEIISSHVNNYNQYTKHEIKVANICKENRAAYEWNAIIIWAKQRSERLEHLSQGINNLSYRISMVQKHKEEAI